MLNILYHLFQRDGATGTDGCCRNERAVKNRPIAVLIPSATQREEQTLDSQHFGTDQSSTGKNLAMKEG